MLPSSEVPLLKSSLATLKNRRNERGYAIPLQTWDSSTEALNALKRSVPRMMEVMGRAKWSSAVNCHRSYVHGTPPPILASRAYHKLREIFFACAIPAPSRSAHLCEAPGGFVQATAEVVREEGVEDWTWVAVSLPESSTAPKMGTVLLPMKCGTCLQSDLLQGKVPEIPDESFDLVTADGAGPMNHDDLEREHLPLLWSQTETAVRILKPGGTLVIKFFEGSLPETRLWMAWVTLHFGYVSVIKPTSSRPTNSERYMVARHFTPPSDPLPPHEECRTSEEWDLHARTQLLEFHDAQIRALRALMHRRFYEKT